MTATGGGEDLVVFEDGLTTKGGFGDAGGDMAAGEWRPPAFREERLIFDYKIAPFYLDRGIGVIFNVKYASLYSGTFVW